MIGLRVEITGADDLQSALSGLRDQVPFATSVAINNTLNDIQDAERKHIHGTFIIRSADFIDRSVYIGPEDRARKNRLSGTVRINPERDVLAKFEEDTSKTPLHAGSLGVPVFRQASPGLIIRRSDPLSLQKLFASLQKTGAAEGRIGRRRGAPKPLDPQHVFLVKNANGTFLIERVGTTTRVLWTFKKAVPIKPELEFGETAMNAAVDRWESNAEDALELAIATMR